MRNKLKRTLTNLWTGELVSVFMFWLNIWLFHWLDAKLFDGTLFGNNTFIAVLYSMSILSLILVQGSIYWLILIKRLSVPQYGENTVGRVYGLLKIIDLVLLCLGIPLIVVFHDSVVATLLSIALLLFAVVEWINYFVLRLSYSYNPAVVIRHIKQGTLKKSKIACEIENAVAEKE